MQLPRLASSLQQWYYPRSLSIWGLRIGGSKRKGLLGCGNCHRAYARFCVVVPGAGTGALHVPRRERSVCFLSSVCDVKYGASATSLNDRLTWALG